MRSDLSRSRSRAAVAVAMATSAALPARLVLLDARRTDGIGSHVAFGLTALFLALMAGLFALVGAQWCIERGGQARRYVAGHRRQTVRAGLAVGAVPLALGLLRWAGCTWRPGAPAAGARVAYTVLAACALGAGTVLVMLAPYVLGARSTRRGRIVAVAMSAWLTAGVLLVAVHLTAPGLILLGLFGVAAYGWLRVADRRGARGYGDYLRCVGGAGFLTLGALVWLRAIAPSTLARWSAATALALLAGGVASSTVYRRLHGARRPKLRRLDLGAATVVLAYVLFLLFDDQMLGGPLEAPLFVLLFWLSIRLRLWMNGEGRRLVVRAGADVVFALALGAVVMLLLAWLANVLELPPTEVSVLKGAVSSVGQSADVSPLIWGGAYGGLSAAYLAAVFGVRRSRALIERLESIRLVPAVTAARSTSTVLGIGVMLVALLGLTVPPTVGPILGQRIHDQYTLSAHDELAAADAIALDEAVARQLAPLRVNVLVLIDMFEDIHKRYPPDSRSDQATPGELALSLRMGELQGRSVAAQQVSDPVTEGGPDAQEAAQQAAEQRLDTPIASAADFASRLDQQQHAKKDAEAREEQAKTATELAAATVTSLLDSVSLGHGELLGMVREYLDGLAESPLGDLLRAWSTRTVSWVSGHRPPTAEQAVIPDPVALRTAAETQLAAARIADGEFDFPDTVPGPTQTSDIDALIAAAVESEDQAITIEHRHTECPRCGRPGEPGQERRPIEIR